MKIFRGIVLTLVLIFAFEGLCSAILFVRGFILDKNPRIAERIHTKYDRVLGWVNIPNIRIENMYGKGIYLKTNSRGFRNNVDFKKKVPIGKKRIVFSGDSFTQGYGVKNEQCWCNLFCKLDSGLQAVNMGVGGYGLDQFYLLYKREGIKLEHDVHVLSFIHHDFYRTTKDSFCGYGKPCLKLAGGKLEIENVPVSKRAYFTPWLNKMLGGLRELRSLQLLGLIIGKDPDKNVIQERGRHDGYTKLVLRILDEINYQTRANGSTCIFVYLPLLDDYYEKKMDGWRNFLGQKLHERGYIFLDLVEEFRKLPSDNVKSLYISKNIKDYTFSKGHYSVKGNQYIAFLLYKKMKLLGVL